jgi:hypothetical protein
MELLIGQQNSVQDASKPPPPKSIEDLHRTDFPFRLVVSDAREISPR